MIRSKKYLAGSRGQSCSLRIPGVCNGNAETVVPAHIRDAGKGVGTKASDISVANACSDCHAVFDGQRKMPDGHLLEADDWLFFALRGLQETLEQRIGAGLLIVPQDVEPKMMDKPIRERKPKEQRVKIQSRGFPKKPTEIPGEDSWIVQAQGDEK